MIPKTSLSPSLMQLPELKRDVTCDKNSGSRFHGQTRFEFAYELHLSSQKFCSTNISLANQFLYIKLLLLKKDCKSSAIILASVERT